MAGYSIAQSTTRTRFAPNARTVFLPFYSDYKSTGRLFSRRLPTLSWHLVGYVFTFYYVDRSVSEYMLGRLIVEFEQVNLV
jgi:hypothetical protein